jgi:phosphoserine phosphatase
MTLLKSPARHPTPHNLSWPTSNVAFDMDSTINIECVDEIAGRAGRKAEVAAITEGYAGDYHRLAVDSLRQRVALLKGVRVQHGRVCTGKVQAQPGAAELVNACKKRRAQDAAGQRWLHVLPTIAFGMTWTTRSNVLGVEDGF